MMTSNSVEIDMVTKEEPDERTKKEVEEGRLSFMRSTVLLQFVLLCFYGAATNFADASSGVADAYAQFTDVHTMLFVGFGFLALYMSRYTYSAVGYIFVVAAMAVQWAVLVIGFFNKANLDAEGSVDTDPLWHDPIEIDVPQLIQADFAAVAVIISIGAVMGRMSPTQMLWMAIFEVFFYGFNWFVVVGRLEAVDVGGTMTVHTFAAFFGLGVSWMIKHGSPVNNPKCGTTKQSNLQALLGTLFLWVYWPSFNSAMVADTAQVNYRVVVNTVIALAAGCTFAFSFSAMLRSQVRFHMRDVQTATLAAGVAVAASAQTIRPWAAMMIGGCAGGLTVLANVNTTKWLRREMHIDDASGMFALHGVAGIFGGFVAVFTALAATETMYGDHISTVYPAREVADEDRSAGTQASFQFLGLLLCMAFGATFGIITGAILRFEAFNPLHPSEMYEDSAYWQECADVEAGNGKSANSGKNAPSSAITVSSSEEKSETL